MDSFTPLPVYHEERRHYAFRVGGWMGYSGGQDVLGKGQTCFNYQNRNPDLLDRRKNTVLLFRIVVITDFRLSGLDFEL